MSSLILTRGGDEAVAKWAVPTHSTNSTEHESSIQVQETVHYGFTLSPAPADFYYHLKIGDFDASKDNAHEDDFSNYSMKRFGENLLWNNFMYFESARGKTPIHLFLSASEGGIPSKIYTFYVYVVPSKIGEERYNYIADDLRKLSGALLLDLIGKSRRSIDISPYKQSVSFRSKEMELYEVQRLWNSLGPIIGYITKSPVTRVVQQIENGLFWGERGISLFDIRQLAIRGIHPGINNTPRPFQMKRKVLKDSFDIPEHRLIAGFLELLLSRLRSCRNAIINHRKAIKEERKYRDYSFSGKDSLYTTHDKPKIEQLSSHKKEAECLYASIYNYLYNSIFRGLPRVISIPDRDTFTQNNIYRKAKSIIEQFLLSSSIWLGEESTDTITKLSSRMYEQWVFLVIVESLRQQGLEFTGWEKILHDSIQNRFTIDFERGLEFTAPVTARKYLRIRYEPWVLPEEQANREGETVYHGNQHQVPWSPDILIECLYYDTNGQPCTVYAVAVDCKYSRKIYGHHWESTRKYKTIRSCFNNRQVVRQLWLVNPDEKSTISLTDPAITFSNNGPSCDVDETMEGILPVVPNQERSPEAPVKLFTQGVINYFSKRVVIPTN